MQTGIMGIPQPINSELWVTTCPAAVVGSTETSVAIFTVIQNLIGGDIQYISDPVQAFGDKFVVVNSGLYFMTHQQGRAGSATDIYITLNSTNLTTSPTFAQGVISWTSTASGNTGSSSTIKYLHAGDIIRAQTVLATGNTNECYFKITRIS